MNDTDVSIAPVVGRPRLCSDRVEVYQLERPMKLITKGPGDPGRCRRWRAACAVRSWRGVANGAHDPDRGPISGGRQRGRPGAPVGGPDRPHPRGEFRHRGPSGRRHRGGDRSGVARRPRRQHAADRGELLRHQSEPEEAELRSVHQLRAGLSSGQLAAHRRGEQRLALSQLRRPDQRGAGETGRIDHGECRPRHHPAHRLRECSSASPP